MTVIAWDGKTLAADKMSADEWTVRTVTKIRRVRGGMALCGSVGDADRGRALIHWFDKGGEFPATLARADALVATLLVVHRDGTVEMYQREPHPIVLDSRPVALGSGADAAMAAMLCGRDAATAVRIASTVCRGVGCGVDTLSFEEAPCT